MESTPTFVPITLDHLKSWLNIDGDHDDTLIDNLASMAVDQIERTLDHRFADREVVFSFDALRPVIRLPLSPVTEIVSVTYLDDSGERQEVEAFKPSLNKLVPSIAFESLSGTDIEITARVGYLDPEAIPASLKHAVAVMVADYYANREGTTVSDRAVASLVRGFRKGWSA